MGIKSNYFRHSFDAHNDPKIRKLIQQCGAKAYAIYFILLEVYCARLRDDDSAQIEQEIDLKLLASYLGLRSDSVHSCIIVMGELGLISSLSQKYDQTMIKLSIHNSLKYYGFYKNVRDEKCPNKRKEKERKENKISNNIIANNNIVGLDDFGDDQSKNNTENQNQFKIIIDHLNHKTGKNYRHSVESTRKFLRARLRDGFSVDDFISVIDKKCKEWTGGEFEKYLRPSTLFGTKFENYLNQEQPTTFEDFLKENAPEEIDE